MTRNTIPPLHRPRRPLLPKRDNRPIPGDRVQLDTCKLGHGKYLYTAIDDCTRYLVVQVYPRRTSANTLLFLEYVIEEMPIGIQRLQTDHGTEFTAYAIRDQLFEWHIRWRLTGVRAPHLNGKVERAQKTVLEEFFTTIDLNRPDLNDRLAEWQDDYNRNRIHGSLGKTPMQRTIELYPQIPSAEDLYDRFDEMQRYELARLAAGVKRSR
ncbi:MAG: DDE-type integrase/transposase/recombinase [Dehalococcoidia bacterium]